MNAMHCIAALLLSTPLAAGGGTQLEVVDHTLGESSGSATTADLPRGDRISFRVSGAPGDAVLLLASPTEAAVPPPLLDGQPLLVDPASMVVVVNGLENAGAVIGPSGIYDLSLVLPTNLPLGGSLFLQGLTVSPGGIRKLSKRICGKIIQTHVFEFETDAQGWVGGFSDYPVGEEVFYELDWNHSTLPPPLDQAKKGLRMKGNNHSDDLFMFLKRQVAGLEAGTEYKVDVEVELASQYPASWLGVGGAPGSGVYIHAGASLEEPIPVVDPLGWYVMNIQKGNQAMPGAQSHVLGHIGIPESRPVYTIIERETSTPVLATADPSGKLWLHIGTDSGFESLTEVWYDRLVFRIRK
jgi:hypothetical protein